ncbi:Ig-like domain repeat protein [Phytohabitans sp. ZYX-F-186]|uniref:Ig-like domain repeat protein n=1 Tax=Phytohabitans maris TaxID=3071409 RepID=A0ABU0Z7I9_9ACTN|nr:Ig-like domain repeat protein [Phytohabitans sp. ZYX-F-186]MDQ7903025.1 Ig-like domain repeat protein [Phytohabitans sp. ZYX-F-186]
MSKRMFARAGALLGAAVMSAGVLVAVASPAQAASLGGIDITPANGTVDASPMFTSATSSAPCPSTFGENAGLRVGPVGGPYQNLGRPLGGGGYDQAPVTIAPNRSLAQALGVTTVTPGSYLIIIECFSLTAGRHADEFQLPIVVEGTNWRVDSGPVAEDTTTTLAVSPATVESGAEVTLTATVAPSTAEGTVQFRRGASTVIGTAPVASGTATLTTTSLPIGTHSITAVFTPANASAFNPSTSSPQSVTVELGDGPAAAQEIVADITPGAFSLAVAGNSAVLEGGTVGGTATGDLQTATVTDLRGSNAGWDLTGQLEDFNTTPATTAIGAANLTWAPTASKTSGSGSVTAGAGADLGATRTLCTAAESSSAGVFDCGAGLTLSVPDTAAPGGYAATLTLTLA